MKNNKFPKFEAHIPKMHWDWYDEDAKKEIEQALTQAENKGRKSAERQREYAKELRVMEQQKECIAQLEEEVHNDVQYAQNLEVQLKTSKQDGAKAERERVLALLAKLRNNRFVYNDEMKLAIDMIKDEITR
jgi:organic radical activating enzyme